jgi:hypothetical protein
MDNKYELYKVSEVTYEDCIKPFLDDLIQLRIQGLSPLEICQFLSDKNKIQIPVFLLFVYIEKYPDLYEAWYASNLMRVHELEETAYRIAKGYSYDTSEDIYQKNKDTGENELVGTKVNHSYVRPDAKMVLEVLKVLHGNRWSGKNTDDRKIIVEFPKDLDEFAG